MTEEEAKTEFAVGDRVFVEKHYGRGFSRESRVEKIHKTGRFKIEGDSAQWRPTGSGSAMSGSGFSLTALRAATPEHVARWEAQVQEARRTALATDLCERIKKCPDIGILHAIRAVLDSNK